MSNYAETFEKDLTFYTLIILDYFGPMSTRDLKDKIQIYYPMTVLDSRNHTSRSSLEASIRQMTGNIVSHRYQKTNIIHKGFVTFTNGIFSITSLGKVVVAELARFRYSALKIPNYLQGQPALNNLTAKYY